MDPYAGNMQEPMTLHRYLYTSNNPVMYVDPSGEFFDLGSLSAALNIRSILTDMQLNFSVAFASKAQDTGEEENLFNFNTGEIVTILIPYGGIIRKISKFEGKYNEKLGNLLKIYNKVWPRSGFTTKGVSLNQGVFKHIMESHTLDYMKYAKRIRLKKYTTTVWPPGTSSGDILRYLKEAISKHKGVGPESITLRNGDVVELSIKGKQVEYFFPVSGKNIKDIADYL